MLEYPLDRVSIDTPPPLVQWRTGLLVVLIGEVGQSADRGFASDG